MAIEFDPALNRYQSVTSGIPAAKSAETTKTSEAESTKKASEGQAAEGAASEGKIEQEPDSVELSDDAKSVNKMSAEERAALVKSLKADQEYQMTRFVNMMTQTFTKQGFTQKNAEDDSFWKMFSSGNLSVDLETKKAAQEAISEDGYWGVNQTSDRIIDFAKALTGGDPDKIEEMRSAFEKGFKKAGKTWGGDLPDISQRTYDAVMEKFDKMAEEAKKTSATPVDTEG